MTSTTTTRLATDFDRGRARIFLEKADLDLPDAMLAGLRSATDAALGIDEPFLREARSAFGIGASARLSRFASQGTFHRLYEVHEAGCAPRLLRVAAIPGASTADLMALECGVMRELRARGFPVPACEHRDVPRDGVPCGVHLVEQAAGASLATIDADEDRMRVALEGAARFLARLHRVPGTGFGPLSLAAFRGAEGAARSPFAGVHGDWDAYLFVRLEEHLRSCEAAGAITGGEAIRIGACFSAHRSAFRKAPSTLLHGDPGSHNFLFDDSGIRAVVDWEDALVGDPLFDLASLCTFHPERRHGAIWSAYGVAMDAGAEAWTRFWLYFLRIALAKTVHRRRFAYADIPGRAPASRRIQLALRRLEGER